MMSKLKRKAKQQNFLQYFLNEFVFFRRDFSFVSHLSFTEIKDNLCNLDKQKNEIQESRNHPTRQYAVRKILVEFHYISFKVKIDNSKRVGSGAIAEGTIVTENGVSVVKGSVIMGTGLWYLIFLCGIYVALLIWAFLSGLEANEGINSSLVCSGMWVIPFGLMPFLAWIAMYRDRNHLLKIVENAVLPEKQKVKHKGKNHV